MHNKITYSKDWIIWNFCIFGLMLNSVSVCHYFKTFIHSSVEVKGHLKKTGTNDVNVA